MNVLGIKFYGHDTGVALIADKRVTAIAEERLNRIKHSPHIFPHLGIKYCLDVFNLRPEDIDIVAMDQVKGTREDIPMAEFFKKETKGVFTKAALHVVNHHDAHAATAFFCSPFDDAAVLVIDGSGEWFRSHHGRLVSETETLYHGRGNELAELQKTTHVREGIVYPYTSGVGRLYTFLCGKYIGFGRYNEGKMMGLAPFGDDSLLKQIPMERWFTESEGQIVCNARITAPSRSLIYSVRRAISLWAKSFFSDYGIFREIRLPRPSRNGEKLPDKYYSSVAYAGQQILERVAVMWGKKLYQITRSPNICIAGGVGLNIDANSRVRSEAGFEHIFIQPASSDVGIPLGCALWGWHMILKQPRFWEMKSVALGRSYSDQEIRGALEKYSSDISFTKEQNVAEKTAELIAGEKIIGWFQSGAEYGPRALGNRSILCDTRRAEMKDILNNNVKHRESWRPFAVSVLKEHTGEYFDLPDASPFMLLVAAVKKEKQKQIPAVVHVDGTCRIQEVAKENETAYYNLISAYYRRTGVPLILNTSFNLGGDPIVETPEDALECFLKTQMDYLVLEDYLVSKRSS